MADIIVIPDNPTLDQLRWLLAEASNRIATKTEIMAKYRVDLANAKNSIKRETAAAKIRAIEKHSLKASNQTMINSYAACDPAVTQAELQWEVANAVYELGNMEMESLKETSMALKKMISSICDELRANIYGGNST